MRTLEVGPGLRVPALHQFGGAQPAQLDAAERIELAGAVEGVVRGGDVAGLEQGQALPHPGVGAVGLRRQRLLHQRQRFQPLARIGGQARTHGQRGGQFRHQGQGAAGGGICARAGLVGRRGQIAGHHVFDAGQRGPGVGEVRVALHRLLYQAAR